jgi:hypothetical protein
MMQVRRSANSAPALAVVLGLTATFVAQAQHQSPDIGFAASTGNNQVYIGGQVTGPIPPNNPYEGGDGDSFIQAYDQNGNLLWTAEYGSTAQDRVLGIASDPTGVYAGGFTMGPMGNNKFGGSTDAYLAKYSLTGKQLWLHDFGGPAVDRIQAVASDGKYEYVTGYTSESLYGLPFAGEQDCFVQKYDQEGNLQWTTEFGTPGTDRCYGIIVNSQGVFIAGRTDNAFPGWTNLGGLDAFVTMFNGSGKQIWLTQFGTDADERGWGIGADPTGIYVTGRTEGSFPGYTNAGGDDAYLAKFNYSGGMLWVDQFGTPYFDRGNGITADPTGVYGLGLTDGSMAGKDSNLGSRDCYLRKWETSGTVLWTDQFGTTQFDQCWGVITDTTGVYVTGSVGGALPGFPNETNGGFFIQKYDDNGNTIWTQEVAVPPGAGNVSPSKQSDE